MGLHVCWYGKTWAPILRQVEWRKWFCRSRSGTDGRTDETSRPPWWHFSLCLLWHTEEHKAHHITSDRYKSHEKKKSLYCAKEWILTAGESKERSVVETQPELRHSWQHRLQFDTAHDITAHHTAISVHLHTHTNTHLNTHELQETRNAHVSHTHQNINGLNDIYKDFILLVFDALGPPGHGVGHCGGYFGLGHLKLIALLCDVSDNNTKHHLHHHHHQRRGRALVNMKEKNTRSYSWRILLSVVWGNPKSMSSSSSSYTTTKLSWILSSSNSLKYSVKT